MTDTIRLLAGSLVCICCILSSPASGQNNVTLKFIHTANGKPLVLNENAYQTPGGEPYKISKLKYYISNVGGANNAPQQFLIDAAGQDSIVLSLKPGNYTTISFLLGIDSIYNCSGAQDGALDPLNDMFWAWNTGYVMFKLEGSSDSSHADLHRIEHHIGGYKGVYKVMRLITMDLPVALAIGKDHRRIGIEMNLDNYWHSVNDISIIKTPVVVTAGQLAKTAADNFSSMFTIKTVQ